MTLHVHPITGARPRPLGSYLKALGILRIVSEQADEEARGFWRGEHFWLVSVLDRQELESFLLERYEPTPIVAPWNGGSGFYEKNNRTAAAALDRVARTSAGRFESLREAVRLGRELTDGLDAAPEKEDKFALQRRMRERAAPALRQWMDAALIHDSVGEPAYPALQGTGGNEGRFDLTNNYLQRVMALLGDCGEALSPKATTSLLSNALWGTVTLVGARETMSFFDPGSVSGANFGNGFDGKSVNNPWDFVLLMEGVVVIAAAATRKLAGQSSTMVSAPFSVRGAAGGYGSAGRGDEGSRGEQWFPLWSGPASYTEVRSLFAQGRANLGRRSARGATEFARSVARLGVARGVTAFERYGYMERNGQANLATPLGRWTVSAKPYVHLLDDVSEWVSRFEGAARSPHAPAAFGARARWLNDAVLRCARYAATRDWRRLWVLLGEAERQLLASPKFTAERGLQPLPPLRSEWLAAVDDGTPAFRLAVSLARVTDADHPWGLRRHWLPMQSTESPRFATSETCLAIGPDQVARGNDGARALAQVLHRRVQLAQRAGAGHLGLSSPGPGTRLADLRAWTSGEVDSFELASWLPCALAMRRDGAATARSRDDHDGSEELPDAVFSLLRVATPHAPARECDPPVRADPALPAALRAGRVTHATTIAARRLRAAGLVPLLERGTAPRSVLSRLLSGLLFPLDQRALARLRARVTRRTTTSSPEPPVEQTDS